MTLVLKRVKTVRLRDLEEFSGLGCWIFWTGDGILMQWRRAGCVARTLDQVGSPSFASC